MLACHLWSIMSAVRIRTPLCQRNHRQEFAIGTSTEMPHYYFVCVPSVILYYSPAACIYLLYFPDASMYDSLFSLTVSVPFVFESTFRTVKTSTGGTNQGETCKFRRSRFKFTNFSSACTYLTVNSIHRVNTVPFLSGTWSASALVDHCIPSELVSQLVCSTPLIHFLGPHTSLGMVPKYANQPYNSRTTMRQGETG